MLTAKSTVLGSLAGAFIGMAAAVAGCSASGETTEEYVPTQDQKPSEPSNSVRLPPKSEGDADEGNASSSSTSSGGPSKPVGDAGPKTDASAPPPPPADGGLSSGPAVGATCSTIDQKFKQVCGKCGAQEAVCVSTPDGTSGTVSAYGPCDGEHGDCAAGATESCGKCGTKTCSNSCGWGTCQHQGICKEGQIQHDNAGCPTPGTYRSQVCGNTCTWGSFSACEEPSITLPAPGATSSTIWELKTSQMGNRPGSCKRTTSLTPVTVMPVKLVNPTSADAKVQIWHTSAGAAVDTTIFTYLRDQPPAADAEWKMCHTESVDGCTALQNICAVDGNGHWAGVDNVNVPANSTVIIMNAGFLDDTVGKFVLNVKTK